VQVVMFVAGFLIPFAWMIAAILPLPQDPMKSMQERDNSTANLDESDNAVVNDASREFKRADEARFESAKWWRKLNRWMSLVGLLVIAAIIILAVEGTRRRW